MSKVEVLPIWSKQSFARKIKAILTFNWKPDNQDMLDAAEKVLRLEMFGDESDFGDVLFDINLLHHHRLWNLDSLTEQDEQKVNASAGMRMLIAQKHAVVGTNKYLNLQLVHYNPMICSLCIPMILKIPVVSMLFAIELQENFTFNSIRQAKHPQADELIAYIYDTLLIQQKIASSFHRLLSRMNEVQQKKGETKLSIYEMDAISECDLIINYLKSSVEKIVLILAFTFEVTNLETYKKHQQKLKAIDLKLPPKAKAQPYFGFIWKFIQPEELEKLNNLRTGINHKKGVSKLQPHSYMDSDLSTSPIGEIFETLMDQHRKNSAMLIGVLALLTDDLVFRDPPTGSDLEFAKDLRGIYL
ncbi:hypothetical protein FA048_14610 [Pedobacter polaris]|uniref:Uncharacterized protein n=1 Tax=Pedobacter polaris TaxID=2571273 RepID=A0A4U1CL31_9SPHI|nr:hypothetical protein [Pedobacter polaris]TKC08384.1 hypothetical protein FA048_14610 [Pedobacter polaris]